MQKEELILKWLDEALTPQEFEAFKSLEDYDALVKLSESLKQFKAPDYDASRELNLLLQKNQKNKSRKNLWLKPLVSAAAILVICIGVYFYSTTLETTVQTFVAEKTTIELPDLSEVVLNSESTLEYNKNDWRDSRTLSLQGEAYFKVEKGHRFTVTTSSGKVTVLGTQFNVKQRGDYFEVVCYEGSVRVDNITFSRILKPSESFVLLDGEFKEIPNILKNKPTWIDNLSSFKSLPYHYILDEFERQFNVNFNTQNIDTSIIFTGTFKHTNLEQALQSITIPLGLNYSINDNNIVLSRD